MEKYYIKLYDVKLFYKLSNKEKEVFCELAKRMPLGNVETSNHVYLTHDVKKSICRELGITSVHSFDVAIYNIIKKGLVERIGNNHFLVNPNIVGKGSESKLSKTRWLWNNKDIIDKKTGEILEEVKENEL